MVLSAILGAIRTHIDCTNISYCSASVSRVISRRKKR
ncbi:Protein kinase superfamily protein [Zea mays]|uniref:Protein kinase superfamily protein n=1 Tax=Zea mays TaxID=4577 RepID=A0A1D6N871_MAIZE|nr:Protein kinase superfamily protein [Zea mays]